MLKTAITHYGPRLTMAGIFGLVVARLVRLRRERRKPHGLFGRVLAH